MKALRLESIEIVTEEILLAIQHGLRKGLQSVFLENFSTLRFRNIGQYFGRATLKNKIVRAIECRRYCGRNPAFMRFSRQRI